ncbi:methionyl-tRNA formyltransferase [Cryobacterium sp. TMT1-21]|uniref:Methionyl-tRNA formyltransferase n=1 Tax=Cryobacterium shii TaxID=1259235 RepID=A0AAQ2HGJ1_9MICO|nr:MULTISPECIES: methionyl-tRNA formyltransferase [Cryobacterium]TFC51636.1 methionyl-tRNA formyltransferase [Cryobacterium shii]TFC83631.1 methionyl-tRNA formyltransferase [Cryobacterium sp. TmT2-59]TFD13604.1 methionyl-tRNA formyltransferase [Cryobacterium sp. TMT4-10]TFD16034.1 methionyl-tRNA formyltransferase [Cryobacterium sp. TMT1-21]TFD27124.1 methionyl-tRNA formyltransferase [Cryobacterium sp. TMT2-23]
MKLVFAGTPQAAVPSLVLLNDSRHEIAAVISRADAPLGRKRLLTPSPVAQAAEERGLRLLKANRLDASATEEIAALQPDLGVIVAYGGLVREPLLSVPRLGWINLHFSLLPRWRGAAPVQCAVIAGDELTGAAVFQLVPELDAGPVFAQSSETIGADATSGSLLAGLSESGARLLLQVIDDLEAGVVSPVAQVGEVTLAPKLTLADARIDWSASAQAVYSRVRGVTPEPGAFTELAGARLKLLDVAPATGAEPHPAGLIREIDKKVLIGTGTEPLELVTVQPAGKKPMKAVDWWRGVAATEVVAS